MAGIADASIISRNIAGGIGEIIGIPRLAEAAA
jgi:hypothetical protein